MHVNVTEFVDRRRPRSLVVSGLGFWAPPVAAVVRRCTRWSKWALAGREFGSWIGWFVLGGDLYTAYTYVAVPALLYGAGALGFYAMPVHGDRVPRLSSSSMIRFWSVCEDARLRDAADYVRGRFGSPTLALAIAITGIVATMPYIALNLLGMQAMLQVIGIGGDWPLVIAFVGARRVHLAARGCARPR